MIDTIAPIAVIVLVAAICATLALSHPKHTPYVDLGNYTDSKLFGTSMLPTIKEGDRYSLDKRFPYYELELGDIVAYNAKGMHCYGEYLSDGWIHRVHAIKVDSKNPSKRQYIMKGDNNGYTDSFVLTRHNYGGKVVEINHITINAL
jgi:signal peptidase I